MYTNNLTLKVRYAETDQMGIVHHSNYYIWFEAGRSDFILHSGMSYKELEEQGILLPLIESSCKYHEGAKYEDLVIIETAIEELSPVKIIFQYKVLRTEDNKLLAEGRTVQAFVNKEFKIINLKKTFPAIYERFLKLI